MSRNPLPFIASLIVALLATQGALARPDPAVADLCREAAADAAAASGVPFDVLLSVSLVETGRDNLPWPWTVNIGGESHWSDTQEEAAALVEAALQSGLTNVDLGCFQLNLHWHSRAFTSVEDMLDPARNAAYAADFLAEKFRATGDWSEAAAAYHSATPEHAERYQGRFDAVWADLDEAGPADPASDTRRNGFPLLLAGKSASPGSLFPSTASGSPLIGGP